MDSFATAISIMLQYGVPLQVLVQQVQPHALRAQRVHQQPEIPMAKSVTDYLFKWLAIKFLGQQPVGTDAGEDEATDGLPTLAKTEPAGRSVGAAAVMTKVEIVTASDAPPCSDCGSVMIPNGSCYRCVNCGGTGCS
jgi:ribonucleoside-diphosphate reductase alpha chain